MIFPSPASHNPATALSSELLPTPLGPMINSPFPGGASAETSRTRVWRESGVIRVTCSRAMRGLLQRFDARAAPRPFLLGTGIEGRGKGLQTGDPRDKVAQLFELRHDDRQRAQDLDERAFGLGNDAELDLAGEVHRGHHDDRQDEDEVLVPFGEELQVPLPTDQEPQVADGGEQPLFDLPRSAFLAPVEGDRFGVVADVHQTVTEVGLLPELLEVEVDQFLAEEHGNHGADGGIGHQDEDQGYGDAPEDPDKGDELDEGKEEDGEESKAGHGERRDILRDPLIRVVDALVVVDPVIGPV